MKVKSESEVTQSCSTPSDPMDCSPPGSSVHGICQARVLVVIAFSPSAGRQTENHNHRKLTNLITWTTALSSSMKLCAMPFRATQDGQVMVESSDKMWSTGKGNGKPLQYSCLENPMNSMKRKR